MADDKLATLLETQISLSEWIQRINHDEAAALAEEDNYKRERIGKVSAIIGLPYDKPTQFEAADITKRTPPFNKFLEKHGDELCALRLIPKRGNEGLTKLRMRGKSIREVLDWFAAQEIDPEKYMADFVPHAEASSWATIFVVNDEGIFGEIYFGGHHVLTQGVHGSGTAPHVFAYNFADWKIDPANDEALEYLKEMIERLKVTDSAKQEQLKEAVNAAFAHDYLKGYFETTHAEETGTWFIDYNRILGERYKDFQLGQLQTDQAALVTGRKASGGQVTGEVVLATPDMPPDNFPKNGVLVCQMTSPDYLPLMQKAVAIVTDQGGVLCHAAIVARELGKPCIVGTSNATKKLKNGDKVLINAYKGIVLLV